MNLACRLGLSLSRSGPSTTFQTLCCLLQPEWVVEAGAVAATARDPATSQILPSAVHRRPSLTFPYRGQREKGRVPCLTAKRTLLLIQHSRAAWALQSMHLLPASGCIYLPHSLEPTLRVLLYTHPRPIQLCTQQNPVTLLRWAMTAFQPT